MGKKGEGIRSTNCLLQNSLGDVKYNIGSMVAKEYVCMTHGCGQWCGACLREWGFWWGRGEGGKLGQL